MARTPGWLWVEVNYDGAGTVRIGEEEIATVDWFSTIMALSKASIASQEAVCMAGAARMASHHFEYYRTNLPR